MIKTLIHDVFDNEKLREQPYGTRFYVDETGTLLIMDPEDLVLDAYAKGTWVETHLEVNR